MKLPSGLTLPDDEIADLCQRYHIRELSVFGSAVRSNFTAESDVDILVDLEPGTRLGWSFFGIAEELESILGRSVDLGTSDSLKAFVRPSVLREAIVVYAA